MAPPLRDEQRQLLDKVVNIDKFLLGRDKLYALIKEQHKNSGISRRQIMEFLKTNHTNEIHDQPIDKNQKKQAAASNFKKTGFWYIDLMEMNPDNGFKYLLVMLDRYSRFLVAEPIRNKKEKTVTDAIDKVIEGKQLKVSVFFSDNGTEFTNKILSKFCQDNGIKNLFNTVGAPWRNSVERSNRTLRMLIEKNKTNNNNQKWVADVQQLVDNYNNSVHSTTKQKPIDLMTNKIQRNLKANELVETDKLPNGTTVRVKIYKSKLSKESDKTYSKLYYVASSRKYKGKYIYKLKNSLDQIVKGRYTINDLRVSDNTTNIAEALGKPNVIKRSRSNSNVEVVIPKKVKKL